jgi:FkbM family methyltransferase
MFSIFDENGQLVDTANLEVVEQKIAELFIEPDDRVLELGARYGSVSCIINSKLADRSKHVAVEPDQRVWDALEKNKLYNHCEFHIHKGFISKRSMSLTNLDDHFGGYGSTFTDDVASQIPRISLEDLIYQCGFNFNVLVADCEGFLERFIDENPAFLPDLRLIVFEEDYPEKCNYHKIKQLLEDLGFICILEGFQNIWKNESQE